MKTLLTTIFSLFVLLAAAPANAQSIEQILDFHVDAELTSDRMLTITETIKYDFGNLQRRGIFRVIPERYNRFGAKYRYRYEVGETLMDGRPVDQQVTREGSSIRIRLGNPDITITGVHTYTITYTTDRAINDFPEDGVRELYWNVTGNEWQVPIQKASVTLQGPGKASDLICFTGPFGSTSQDCAITSGGNVVEAGTNPSAIQSMPELLPYHGLTVAIRWPEELIAPLTWQKRLSQFAADNYWLSFPVIVFILMYGIWYSKGRDPKGRGTVIAEYEEPRGLKPIEMDALLNQHISNRAVAATVLDLGRRGYLKIVFEGDPTKPSWGKKVKFTLKKLKEADAKMEYFEDILFQKMFGWKDTLDVSEVNGDVAVAIQGMKKAVFTTLEKKKLFGKNPAVTRTIWMTIGFFILFGSIYVAPFGIFLGISCAVSALIILGFGWFMPRATREGAIAREEILGLKKFLSVTETDRIKFHNAPETRPEQFERFLPAAVAFGVEKQWAGHFEKLHIKPPSYVEGNTAGWTALSYSNFADSFYSQASSSAFRAPSSSGSGGSGFSGGGSGGGGGGGGGGSW
jgi:uncharacterized membrane protein